MTASLDEDLARALERHGAGSLAEAEALYKSVLARRPDHPVALHFLGVLASQTGHNPEAEQLIRSALRLRPDDADAHNNLGLVLHALGRDDEAIASYRQALSLNPALHDAKTNLGNVLSAGERADEAVAVYRDVIAAHPQDASAWHNLGIALKRLGRLDEAVQAYRHALDAAPDMAEAHHALGIALLQGGHFPEGWAEYEWRWRDPGFPAPRRAVSCPLWDGAPLAGRSILLHAEQGLGDTLQFVRFVPDVKARGGRVVLACDAKLHPLLGRLDGIDRLVTLDDPLARTDVHAPLLSLPHLLGLTLDTIPARTPYLAVPDAVARTWRERLAAAPGFKVGLVWAGNPDHPEDARRSLAFGQLAPLLDTPGATFLGLQFGPGRARIGADPRIEDLADAVGPFEDMAAAIAALDLLVTVDTAPAHLAGALGVPAWVLLPFDADWRWMKGRADSPWYPSLTLFRQPAPGDWETPIGAISDALARAVD